jgi:hypothetical protein
MQNLGEKIVFQVAVFELNLVMILIPSAVGGDRRLWFGNRAGSRAAGVIIGEAACY